MADIRMEQRGSSAKVHPYLHLLRFHLVRGGPFLVVSLVLLVLIDQVLALHPRFAFLTAEERGMTLGWLLVADIVVITLIASQRTQRQLSLVLPLHTRRAFLIEACASTVVGLVLSASVSVLTSLRVLIHLASATDLLAAVALALFAILLSVLLPFSAALVSGQALFALLTLLVWIAIAVGAAEYASFPFRDDISLFLLVPSLVLPLAFILTAVERIATRQYPVWNMYLMIGLLIVLVPGLYLLNLSWPRLGAAPILDANNIVRSLVPHFELQYVAHPVSAEPTAYGIRDRAEELELELMEDWLILRRYRDVTWVQSLRTGKRVRVPDRNQLMIIDQELYFMRVEPGAPQRLLLSSAEDSSSWELNWTGPRISESAMLYLASWAGKDRLLLHMLSEESKAHAFLASSHGSLIDLGYRTAYSDCKRFIAVKSLSTVEARLYDLQREAFLDFKISPGARPICNQERLAIVTGTYVDLYSLAGQGEPTRARSWNLKKHPLPGWSNDHPYYFESGALFSVLLPEQPLLRLDSAPAMISWIDGGQVLFRLTKGAYLLFDPATRRSWRLQLGAIKEFDSLAIDLPHDRLALCGWLGCKRCSLADGRCEDVPLGDIPIKWLN